MGETTVERAAELLQKWARMRGEARCQRATDMLRVVEQTIEEAMPGHGRVWLIGSLVWGGFGEKSDVDLVVSGLSADEAVRLEKAVLKAANTPVDLLEYEALPPTFRMRVEQEGVEVHAR